MRLGFREVIQRRKITQRGGKNALKVTSFLASGSKGFPGELITTAHQIASFANRNGAGKKKKEKVLGLLNRGPHLKWADKKTANISATVTFKFLAKNEDQLPTNDSSGGFVSGLCLLSPLPSPPLGWRRRSRVGREGSAPGEGGASPRPGPPPHPPAGGFPG